MPDKTEDLATYTEQFSAYEAEAKKSRDALDKRLAEVEAKLREETTRKVKAIIGNRSGGYFDDPSAVDPTAERKAFTAFIRTGADRELKALSVGSDPDGGFVVFPSISQAMTKRLFDQSAIRRLARVETLQSGDAFEEPVDIDDPQAVWIGETGVRAPTTTPTLKLLRIPLAEIYALQPISQKLLDTADRDMAAWAEEKIADKFARTEGTAFVIGDGVGKPRGFLTYPTNTLADTARDFWTLQHVKTGDASGFAATNPADALKELLWSLRAPYRTEAAWVLNSNTASIVDKFKDANGQYLWRDSFVAGQPPTLLGFPVQFDETMPDIAANALPVAFGNFQLGYTIVERLGVRMVRDPFTDKPNILLYAYKRVGGGVANSDAIKLLKVEA